VAKDAADSPYSQYNTDRPISGEPKKNAAAKLVNKPAAIMPVFRLSRSTHTPANGPGKACEKSRKKSVRADPVSLGSRHIKANCAALEPI
jgi:hypothetical protein